MNTISEILENSYSDQGVQGIHTFYDSIIFNLKVKDDSSYNNILLIEKLIYDYEEESLKRIKNPIQVNFGDTENPLPNLSNGNCFVDAFLDHKRNIVLLVGLHQMANGNTIPVIYQYDINQHSVSSLFPKQGDIDQFNSFTNHTYKPNSEVVVKYCESELHIVFQTQDLSTSYMNRLKLKVDKERTILTDYALHTYALTTDIEFTNSADNFINFKVGDYHGILVKLTEGETVENPSIYVLDDSFSIYTLDSTSVLRLDG